MLKKILLSALLVSNVFAAHQVEVNLNDRELEGGVQLDLARMGYAMSNTYFGVHFLNGDQNNSATIKDINPLMEVSFLVMRPVSGVPGLNFGMGIKGKYTRIDGNTYATLPLGMEGELQLPLNTAFPVYAGGSLYYAPQSLAFANGEKYFETRLHVDVQLIRDGKIEFGYRQIDTDLKNTNITYNDAWYFGMRLDF